MPLTMCGSLVDSKEWMVLTFDLQKPSALRTGVS